MSLGVILLVALASVAFISLMFYVAACIVKLACLKIKDAGKATVKMVKNTGDIVSKTIRGERV